MDAEHRMVTVNGIRYRIDDAQRLGLVADVAPADTDTAETQVDTSGTKSEKPVRHKARRPARGAHGGNDDATG
ncbi:hypothetical protein [Saccharopolyspora shandongensis]|uniref:Uncharacterized protein n=1 Tax=Saccharopolyspora shandongensis TaxID=418495 RepID=A0A1H3TN23_9PSEU|nr:hypothetical protein [Saccharopolyspora shandongensis]SDZ51288.1 hypothetical protein SAMN05216215_108720 [Saccharopolyspora shandongensis]